MDLQNAWSVVSKDFEIFKRRKGVLYATIAFPLGIALGFPGILVAIEGLFLRGLVSGVAIDLHGADHEWLFTRPRPSLRRSRKHALMQIALAFDH